MTQQEWVDRVAATVANQVRARREHLGMSAQGLANECAALGFSIQRSVIANFENGRRTSVTFAEILVFSAALGISPMELTCPVGKESEIEPLPGVKMDPYKALLWLSGMKGSLDESRRPDGLHSLPYAAFMVNALEDLRVLKRKEKSLGEVISKRRSELEKFETDAERHREGRRERLEQLHAAADETLTTAEHASDPQEKMQLVKEAQRLAEAALAQAKIDTTAQALKARIDSHVARLNSVKIQIKHLDVYLKSSLRAFRDAGLILPQLTPELRYLLEDESEG